MPTMTWPNAKKPAASFVSQVEPDRSPSLASALCCDWGARGPVRVNPAANTATVRKHPRNISGTRIFCIGQPPTSSPEHTTSALVEGKTFPFFSLSLSDPVPPDSGAAIPAEHAKGNIMTKQDLTGTAKTGKPKASKEAKASKVAKKPAG